MFARRVSTILDSASSPVMTPEFVVRVPAVSCAEMKSSVATRLVVPTNVLGFRWVLSRERTLFRKVPLSMMAERGWEHQESRKSRLIVELSYHLSDKFLGPGSAPGQPEDFLC